MYYKIFVLFVWHNVEPRTPAKLSKTTWNIHNYVTCDGNTTLNAQNVNKTSIKQQWKFESWPNTTKRTTRIPLSVNIIQIYIYIDWQFFGIRYICNAKCWILCFVLCAYSQFSVPLYNVLKDYIQHIWNSKVSLNMCMF